MLFSPHLFLPLLDRLGVKNFLADLFTVSRKSMENWAKGNIPSDSTLDRIITHSNLPADVVMDLLGPDRIPHNPWKLAQAGLMLNNPDSALIPFLNNLAEIWTTGEQAGQLWKQGFIDQAADRLAILSLPDSLLPTSYLERYRQGDPTMRPSQGIPVITAHLIYILTGLEIALFREDLGKDPTPKTGLLERFIPLHSNGSLIPPMARWIEFLKVTLDLSSDRQLALFLAEHAAPHSDIETWSRKITRLKSKTPSFSSNLSTLSCVARAAERGYPPATEAGILITAITARTLASFTKELTKHLQHEDIPALFAPLSPLRNHHLKHIFPPLV